MRLRATWWAATAVAATLIVLAIVAVAGSRTETLRKLVVTTLAERLDSDVELRAFSVDTFPTVTIRGDGLLLRLRGRQDDPPLIQIDSFTVHTSIRDLFRRPRRFKHVTLQGLVVNVPPGGLRKVENAIVDAVKDAASQDAARANENAGPSPIIVDELRADGALLRIIPRREGKEPREFAIHALTMQSLGVAQQMPFVASLTNPVPKGLIATNGRFGPWHKSNPGATPLAGRYTFEKADLGTIKGLGGILDSSGEFRGELERIVVKGETKTPDFRLDISSQSVPLNTQFEAVVDGTDGDTYLNTVDAEFLRTSLDAKGAVVGTRGIKGRTIKLHVQIRQGRIEDLLRLSVKASKPLMIGRVALHTDFTLPPGQDDVIERLRLAGEFDVDSAQFTDPTVQQKVAGLSRRARGRNPEEERADNVVSDLSGRFRLANGELALTDLSFSIPGARVQLHGTYGLRTEVMAFDGTLAMQATISQAAGSGLKSFFLRIVDPVFRKKNAGAVLPIRIRGTPDHPKFGLDIGRVLRRK